MSDPLRPEGFALADTPTPLVDLDDHRFQPSSMPRTHLGEGGTASRRGTHSSTAERPSGRPLHGEGTAIQWNDVTIRDFPEHAIVDDGRSVASVEGVPAPISGRRSTFRRAIDHASGVLLPPKSRTSSTSSRSTSPAGSVEAFAEARRRDRAGTVRSSAPSQEDLGLRSSRSRETQHHHATFDSRSVARSIAASTNSLAEEDVCYPHDDEHGKKGPIDFEDLDEMVAIQRAETEAIRALHSTQNLDVRTATPEVHATEVPLGDEKHDDAEEEVREVATTRAETGTIAGPNEPPLARPLWSFLSSDLDDTIYSSTFGGLLADGETSADLFNLQNKTGGVWWLDVLNPTEDEVTTLCKAFGVHPLSREDIVTQETREKVELFHTYYFVCFRSFYQTDPTDEAYLEPVNVYIVVFREGLLTFTYNSNPHASNVRRRIGRLRDFMQMSSDWICYALIDDIVDLFGPVIRDIEVMTDSIEDDVFTARAADASNILRAIGESRKRVMSLLRLLGGKADVIKGFAKRCNENFSVAPRGDVGLYLSDIQDHVVTMIANLAHFEKMLSRSHSNYLAQIQVNSISQGVVVQDTLGKVTLAASVLVPLNLVTGLFGMNVNVPGGSAPGLGWWFGILGLVLVFITVCLVIARRKKMI